LNVARNSRVAASMALANACEPSVWMKFDIFAPNSPSSHSSGPIGSSSTLSDAFRAAAFEVFWDLVWFSFLA